MDSAECVKVAVNVRPLITPELLIGCTDCIATVPNEPQVQIGSHSFTYDYVYNSSSNISTNLYDECVAPLVEALFQGYNATVLAYGQTGSGKTYTMGTNYSGDGDSSVGIIPKVMHHIFKKLEEHCSEKETLIRVSFIEIFKEEVFDLLDPSIMAKPDGGGAKIAPLSRVPIQIRETAHGGIILAGVNEPEVRNNEEMASYLFRGSLTRATASTNMNSQSSRSHAIFTICLEQRKLLLGGMGEGTDDLGDEILCSKLHLVDLAGSERAKRTGADGLRLKEGIHINKGLLALGNVISALGDDKKRKEGGHVPYRDSKLTRLLQDSLGGNSKTIMIACVSPAETNAEETLNTLKYANRARNIQNKAIVNRDPMAIQMQRMRSQIEQLQNDLSFYRGDSCFSDGDFQILKQKMYALEVDNGELKRELESQRETCESLTKRAIDAETGRDKLAMQIELARNGKSWDEIEGSHENFDVLQSYVSKIKELEEALLRMKKSSKRNHNGIDYHLYADEERFCSQSELFPSLNEISGDSSSKDEIDDEEFEHSTRQEEMDIELMELDKKLELKEAEMKRFPNADNTVIKLHYEKKVQELEHEKRTLQKEIDDLRSNLDIISSTSDESTQKLKQDYLHKLTLLESQVVELKKKQDAQAQLLRQKQKSEEAARRLNDEIQKIKTQKVQLQHKIKQESEQFRHWKSSREKEVLQLKKEGRKHEFEMHKLQALNQRQKMALQRKTEEAAMATKRLREALEGRKTHQTIGNAPRNQALLQAIEHELEVIVRVHEVRSSYERQLEERGRMASELARLKEESSAGKHLIAGDSPSALSPGARTSRIIALENMLAASSGTLVLMASQLSEAEERERGFSVRERWNYLRTIADAKNILNHLFNLASTSRCLLRDREMCAREKDDDVRELKDKVVKLNSLVRHQRQQLKLQKLDNDVKNEFHYLRKSQKQRVTLTEDTDMSETNHSDVESDDSSDEDYCLSRGKGAADDKPYRPNLRKVPCENSESDKMNCCTCSKWSSCKTAKCKCRGANGLCGASCGCAVSKCSNRVKEETESAAESLASQGAALLRDALDSEEPRRPLSDIGNSQNEGVAGKPSRKKWKKAVIQLVPERAVSVIKEEKECPAEDAEPQVRLPAQPPGGSYVFRERNAEGQEKEGTKDGSDVVPSRFARLTRPAAEKENYGK